MGGACCKTLTPEERAIQEKLRQKKNEDKSKKKLLFLGAGGSGKSTLFKQFEIINGNVKLEKSQQYHGLVHQNLITGFQKMVDGGQQLLQQLTDEADQKEKDLDPEEELTEKKFEPMLNALMNGDSSGECDMVMNFQGMVVDKKMAGAMKKLWMMPAMMEVWQRRGVLQIQDSLQYFVTNIDRIASDGYMPNKDDCLRVRSRTTGIVEKEFKINSHNFLVVDVGGQRNERKKWIHAFSEVTAVIFVAALSAFDQTLYEEDGTNRMHESLRLFEDILKLPTFQDTDLILFLNKQDLFEDKILNGKSITTAFPDYRGADTVTAQMEHIKQSFLSKNTNERHIYSFYTTATDTKLIGNIFKSVQATIVRNSLKKAGLI